MRRHDDPIKNAVHHTSLHQDLLTSSMKLKQRESSTLPCKSTYRNQINTRTQHHPKLSLLQRERVDDLEKEKTKHIYLSTNLRNTRRMFTVCSQTPTITIGKCVMAENIWLWHKLSTSKACFKCVSKTCTNVPSHALHDRPTSLASCSPSKSNFVATSDRL